MRHFHLFLIVIGLVVLSCRPKPSSERLIEEAQMALEENQKAVQAGKAQPDSLLIMQLARTYEEEARKKPGGKMAPAYLMKAAEVYAGGLGDYNHARFLYLRVFNEYKRDKLAVEALFRAGLVADLDLKKPELARKDYGLFLQTYPGHEKAKLVREAMANLDKSEADYLKMIQEKQKQTP